MNRRMLFAVALGLGSALFAAQAGAQTPLRSLTYTTYPDDAHASGALDVTPVHWGRGGWGGGWRGGWGGNRVVWGGGWNRGWGWNGGWGGNRVVWGGGWNNGWGWNGGWGGNRVVVGWGGSPWVSSWPVQRTVIIGGGCFQPTPFVPSCGWNQPIIYNNNCGGGAVFMSGATSLYPPIASYVPAETNYGPGAVKDFIGVPRDFAMGPLLAGASPSIDELTVLAEIPRRSEPRIVLAPAERPLTVKVSNAASRERAMRFITFGDAQFGEQEYHQAAQRYRFAIEAAPDVADAHFRQGLAYIASNRYDLAAKALRRGLALDPLLVNASFRLDDLYGKNQLAKHSHLDSLARMSLTDRGNADYLYLLGVCLHFDGQTERAQKFFREAARVSKGTDAGVKVFLEGPEVPAKGAI